MNRFVLGRLGFILAWALLSSSVYSQQLLIDQNQREVLIPDRVERIVGITVPSASMVMALDLGAQRLVGINPSARRLLEDSVLGEMFPQAFGIPANMAGDGFAPNVEAILAARPDIIFQWGDRGDSILSPIERLNIPMVTFKYGDTDYAMDWLRLTGQALQRQARADKILAYFSATRDLIEARVAERQSDPPSVLFIFRYRSGLQVAGSGTSMHRDIERAGGRNVAAEQAGFKAINLEQLLLWNPDIILLTNFEPGLSPAGLFNDPLFSHLQAVQTRRVYQYPQGGFVWEPPSQESPLTWQWLHGLFYPHDFSINLRDEIKYYYQVLYDYRLSNEQIDRILRMEQNQSSQNYPALFLTLDHD